MGLPTLPLEILCHIVFYAFHLDEPLIVSRLATRSKPTELLVLSKAHLEAFEPLLYRRIFLTWAVDYVTFYHPLTGLFNDRKHGARRASYVREVCWDPSQRLPLNMQAYSTGARNEDGSLMDPSRVLLPLTIVPLSSLDHVCILSTNPIPVDPSEDDVDVLVRDQLASLSARRISPEVWDDVYELVLGEFSMKQTDESFEAQQELIRSFVSETGLCLQFSVDALTQDLLLSDHRSVDGWTDGSPINRLVGPQGQIHIRLEPHPPSTYSASEQLGEPAEPEDPIANERNNILDTLDEPVDLARNEHMKRMLSPIKPFVQVYLYRIAPHEVGRPADDDDGNDQEVDGDPPRFTLVRSNGSLQPIQSRSI
ncbi:hypothetical protein [Phaffia rhodozyma]|uniref:Uncharacterized protein n=1 Tax=Phaffia rhodozyma TaxID=264483 RepID=A0A0F7SNW4_PHARH|nr:hypothetical protein [Phaffia rhodozyma]